MSNLTSAAEIVLITDYGLRDPNSVTQLRRRLERRCPHATIREAPVEPRSTLNASFWTYVHGLEEECHRDGTLLFVNCAPRGQNGAPCPGNDQEPLVYGVLDNRVELLAMAAGYTLSLVRRHLVTLQEVVYDHGGSQWRSRDAMPDVVRAIMIGELLTNRTSLPQPGRPLDPMDVNVIPPLPDGIWALHVDQDFGNIKTSLRFNDVRSWQVGTEVAVRRATSIPSSVQGEPAGDPPTKPCEYRRGIFEVPVNHWVIAPGSNGGPDPFLEVVKRLPPDTREAGAATLLDVNVGDRLLVEPLG